MDAKLNKVDCFKCAFSYDEEHFIERPVGLPCGHCACLKCIQSIKENTGFVQIKCGLCDVLNSLDVNYCESALLQNLVKSNYQYLLKEIKTLYEETLRKFKSIFEN